MTEGAASDIRSGLEMKNLMGTRTVANLTVTLAMAVGLLARPLIAQPAQASRSHEVASEVYTPALTPAIYLINFLFLYTANPEVAANLPAYKAPIPQPLVDCLEQNPTGCPYADYLQYFENPHGGGNQNRRCFWPDICQEEPTLERMAPRKFRQPEEINEPLGMKRAEQLAHLLGIDEDMILTEREYRCMIGMPPRPPDRETLFRCIRDMTGSNGNAAIPLSSYGLNVNEQGNVRSICAPDAPCFNVNALLGGPLLKIAAECGFLEKLLRMETETQFHQLIEDANACQTSGEPACLIEATCAGGH